jgi:hypothetical protein
MSINFETLDDSDNVCKFQIRECATHKLSQLSEMSKLTFESVKNEMNTCTNLLEIEMYVLGFIIIALFFLYIRSKIRSKATATINPLGNSGNSGNSDHSIHSDHSEHSEHLETTSNCSTQDAHQDRIIISSKGFIKKRCVSCVKTAVWNYPGEASAEYCRSHKSPTMIRTFACKVGGCNRFRSTRKNANGYCKQHMESV